MIRSGQVVVLALFCLCMISGPRAQARPGDIRYLDNANTSIAGPNGGEVFDKCLNDLPGLLKNFQPAGATIANLRVSVVNGVPVVSFDATKKVGFISVTKHIQGALTKSDINCAAPANALGYRLALDLEGSASDVINNVAVFGVDTCITQQPDGSVQVRGRSFVREGGSYSGVVGPVVEKLLRQQTAPLIEAFQALSQKYR